jgi:hypothetical protein
MHQLQPKVPDELREPPMTESEQMRPSTAVLVKDIEEQIAERGSTKLRQILLRRAKEDEFHDFFGPHAMNMNLLLQEARTCGLDVICQGVLDGKYDATKEESDEWAASPEAKKTFEEFLGWVNRT